MNIDSLIIKYFGNEGETPTIEMFDEDNIHRVYSHIVNLFKVKTEIELSVLQLLSYCIYEILDNVITHSGKKCGTVLLRHNADNNTIKVLVADDGVGIKKSLSENDNYKDISEEEALNLCLHDRVTDGKGMGFGLYSTLCLIRNAGVRLVLHSGSHILTTDGTFETIKEASNWQGTIIFIEVYSNKEIEPNLIVDNRTNVEDEFNDEFLDTSEIDELW